MLEHVLKLRLTPGAVDHNDGRFSPRHFAHLSLVVLQNLLNDLGDGFLVLLLFHDDLSDVLHLLLDDGLLLHHRLEHVLDHLSEHRLLRQLQPLDHLLVGSQDLLLALHLLDLPLGDLPRAVLVLLVHVAVLVFVLHLLPFLLGLAALGASSQPAARLLRDFGPVVALLGGAAATAADSLARLAALAVDGFVVIGGVLGGVFGVGFVGFVGSVGSVGCVVSGVWVFFFVVSGSGTRSDRVCGTLL